MSFKGFSDQMRRVLAWGEHAPIEEMEAAEVTAGMNFPLPELVRGVSEPSFEAMRETVNAAAEWFDAADQDAVEAISGAIGEPAPRDALNEATILLRITSARYIDHGDGSVSAIPHDAPDTGSEAFWSLGEAAIHGGARISVLDRPVRAEPVYDGADALAAGPAGLSALDPVGFRSVYRVAVLDGAILQPPAWPSDLARATYCPPETDESPEP